MRFAIVLLCGIFISTLCFAQPPDTLWTRTYGGTGSDEGYSIRQTTDGGYIIAGNTASFGAGGWDVYLIKTDPSGDTVWTRAYGGPYHDHGRSVQQTADGGYIVTGHTGYDGPAIWDVWLLKTDVSGDTVWTKTYGGPDRDFGRSVQQTADGGYIVGGMTESFGAGGWDFYLIKTDSLGDTLWTRTYGGSGGDYGESVQQTADGGYLVAGGTASFGADSLDVYLIKTDASGDTVWTRTYGGTGSDYGYSVQYTVDDIILTGETTSFGAGGWDVYLIRTDSLGDTIWTRTYGGADFEGGRSVQQTADGGYIVAGWTDSFGAGVKDVYVIKTDPLGNSLWTRTFGGAASEYGWSVQETADSGYIVAGRTGSFGAGGGDIWVIRLAPEIDLIPTLSEWGMLIMVLLLLAAGTVAVVRRRRAAVAEKKVRIDV